MTAIKMKCELCQREFAGTDPLAVKRALGFHKRMAHDIKGGSATVEGKRKMARLAHYRKAGLTEQQIEERERNYAAKRDLKQSGTISTVEVVKKARRFDTPEPMALTSCPFCRARFYGVRGDNTNEN